MQFVQFVHFLSSLPQPAPMTAPAHPSRKSSLRDLASRLPKSPFASNGDGTAHNQPTSTYFGINTFGARQMRDKLPKDVYAKLVAAIRH